MRLRNVLVGALAAALLAGMPLVTQAETAIGGSYVWTHQTGGPFEGNGSGYKIFMGTYKRATGVEIGFINFGDLGDGPHAQAWASGLTIGYPIQSLALYGKGGMTRSRVSATSTSEEMNHYRLYYGGGVRWGGNTGLGLRAEYERYDLGFEDTEVASVGLEYRF